MSDIATPTTVKTHLRPIDRDGLMKFAAAGKADPSRRGTNKCTPSSTASTAA